MPVQVWPGAILRQGESLVFCCCKLFFVERKFKPRRIKNTMALLKQFLKYFKAENLIEDYTNFYVKRITPKNEFNLDRIIFE